MPVGSILRLALALIALLREYVRYRERRTQREHDAECEPDEHEA